MAQKTARRAFDAVAGQAWRERLWSDEHVAVDDTPIEGRTLRNHSFSMMSPGIFKARTALRMTSMI